jgi:acyl-homoserine-lactone acylase
MHSHSDVILRLYGEGRGRAAEYWGEESLDNDRWVRTVGIPVRGREWYDAQPDPVKGYLEAYVRGVNDYARKNPGSIDEKMQTVLPITPPDVLAHMHRVLHFRFVTNQGVVGQAQRAMEGGKKGSNAWAVAPSRSESGNSLLLFNPHLPWYGFFLWNEVQLVSPDIDIYGATLVGLPFVAVGFNDYLGWTHTVNTIDAADLYQLTLKDDGYEWDGGVQAFRTRTETMRVLQDDGTVTEEELEIKNSVHGPVIADNGKEAIALRVAGLYESNLLGQYWDMGRATNLQEFEAAASTLQMPMFTTVYADRDGHILSLFGGLVPVRPPGDWNWRGIVPGNTSKTLWTATHAYGELPKVVDPESGWVQNANDPPWTTTLPAALDPGEFPPYMAPRFMHFRAQRSTRLIDGTPKVSFEQLIERKHSTRMELADRILDDLAMAGQGSEDDTVNDALRVLASWDRSTEVDSKGAALFVTFWQQYQQAIGSKPPFARAWDESNPLETPDGLSDPALALEALKQAANGVTQQHGSVDVAWGEIFRLQAGAIDLPANGGFDDFGVFRAMFAGEEKDGKRTALGGDSFIAAVEFSDPVRARVATFPGSSSKPSSPHFGNQLRLASEKKLRPAWLTRKDVEANLERREVLK